MPMTSSAKTGSKRNKLETELGGMSQLKGEMNEENLMQEMANYGGTAVALTKE